MIYDWDQMHRALTDLHKQVEGFAAKNPGTSVQIGQVTLYPDAVPVGADPFKRGYKARTSVKVTLTGSDKAK